MPGDNCMRCGTRVGWVGLCVDAVLVTMKITVGIKTGSRAVMADALYSMIDVISAIMVIVSLRMSAKGIDDEHPYGHGKVEFLAVTFVSLCVAAFAAILFHRVVFDFVDEVHPKPEPLAAAAAALSVAGCFMVWRYAHCVGSRLGSPIIVTHAEHNKVDAISSFAVLVSIGLSWLGLGTFDLVVAVGEIVHILWVSFVLLRRGVDGLLDASTDPRQLSIIARIARGVPGVVGVGEVRTRNLGSSIWVELTVEVAAKRRMHEVGRIRSLVRSEIGLRVTRVENVMIDIRPIEQTDAS